MTTSGPHSGMACRRGRKWLIRKDIGGPSGHSAPFSKKILALCKRSRNPLPAITLRQVNSRLHYYPAIFISPHLLDVIFCPVTAVLSCMSLRLCVHGVTTLVLTTIPHRVDPLLSMQGYPYCDHADSLPYPLSRTHLSPCEHVRYIRHRPGQTV